MPHKGVGIIKHGRREPFGGIGAGTLPSSNKRARWKNRWFERAGPNELQGLILVPRGLDISRASQGAPLPFSGANSLGVPEKSAGSYGYLGDSNMVLSKLLNFSFIAFTLLSENSRTFCTSILRGLSESTYIKYIEQSLAQVRVQLIIVT